MIKLCTSIIQLINVWFHIADSLNQQQLYNTYIMSNMAPQYEEHNSRKLQVYIYDKQVLIIYCSYDKLFVPPAFWSSWEEYVRDKATGKKAEIIVITGTIKRTKGKDLTYVYV